MVWREAWLGACNALADACYRSGTRLVRHSRLMMGTQRVAIVVPGLAVAGGVPAVAAFLYRAMMQSGRYEPHLFSLPMSSRDPSSVRLLVPKTWFLGPRIEHGFWHGWLYQHIGAVAVELEFQRYQPRQLLTRSLAGYDLVQVVAGTPAWAYPTRHLRQPVCLQVATLTMVERQSLFRGTSGIRRLWIGAMSRIVSEIENAALRHLAAVFVENRWMHEHLCNKMDPNKVIFAPPGVDTKRFYPGQYRAEGPILCVGRLSDPRKNVPVLLKAYHRLLQILPTAPTLVLAGKTLPGPDVWRLAESLGVADRIRTYRNLPEQDLAELYRNASLFVLSSDDEGLGIVLLEAMASGVPVVATRCGGPETAVVDGETGYLVPVGDPDALAIRMRDVLSNQAQAVCMASAGRRRVESLFSLEAAARKFLERYDCLLELCG